MGPSETNAEAELVQPEFAWAVRLLAGLEAGVLAGMMMSGWLMIESLRTGHTISSAPNLISTALLGRQGLTSSFGMATLTGLSLHLMMAGLHGVIFASLLAPTARPLWAANAGVLYALASYTVFFGWLLSRMAPILYQRASRPEWMGGFFLFGVILGLYPDLARSLRTPATAAPEPPLPEPPA